MIRDAFKKRIDYIAMCGGGASQQEAELLTVYDEQTVEIERLRSKLAEWQDYQWRCVNEHCQSEDERHCTCVPGLRREIDRLRTQVEAGKDIMARGVALMTADQLSKWDDSVRAWTMEQDNAP